MGQQVFPAVRTSCFMAGVLAVCLAGPAWGQTAQQLKAQQQQARTERAQLQSAIRDLHKQIEGTEASRKEVVGELRASEQAISETSRRLAELAEQGKQLEQEIAALQKQAAQQKQVLSERQKALSKQLHTKYANGLSPWAALLSGDDPQDISRELGYLSYVSQAQAEAIRAVKQALKDLSESESRLQARKQQQDKLTAEVAQQKQELESQRAERERVLIKVGAQLREQRNQADALKRDDQRLGKLVQGIEQTLAQRAEAARQAELARQAAERKRREQARQAQAQAQRQAQADRERIAREQAQREQAQAASSAEPDQASAAAQLADGLHKGMSYPVKGEVQGRFGASRPDGGVWRGIVLRAPEGTAVKAIAAGKVVYANWLKGFGNMVIVDHGQQYMSIYAYNQSLLKSVGDLVSAGQRIATVGATGGQVESGLYFEIRHNGAPINPLLWLKP